MDLAKSGNLNISVKGLSYKWYRDKIYDYQQSEKI